MRTVGLVDTVPPVAQVMSTNIIHVPIASVMFGSAEFCWLVLVLCLQCVPVSMVFVTQAYKVLEAVSVSPDIKVRSAIKVSMRSLMSFHHQAFKV